MRVQLRHNPASTVARLLLDPNESVKTESGVMIAHSAGVELQAKSDGGILQGLKRSMLGGGSFFVSTYTAPAQGGWVDVTGTLPGDIVDLEVTPDTPLFLRRGSWIANSPGVSVDTQWGGMQNMLGGEGGFGFRVTGNGLALASIYGAIDIIELQPGEQVTIDTGHVVAYDLGIRFQMRRAVQGRSIQSLKSGEGWVFDFAGPGRVLLQTRNPHDLVRWIQEHLPRESGSSGNGGGFQLNL